MSTTNPGKYLSQVTAKQLDECLMGPDVGYSVDQLMELAGQSVAQSIYDGYPPEELQNNNILICCGPGNNGGDGLVAARYLKEYGYRVTICYPKVGRSEIFQRLLQQLKACNISVLFEIPTDVSGYNLIVDAIFGFGFSGEIREPFKELIDLITRSKAFIISVDVPSGWNVDGGPQCCSYFSPACVVSLTAPKKCLENYTGKHYLGGRFVPESTREAFAIKIPRFPGTAGFVKIS